MKFENMKIQPSEINAKGVVSAPDRLSGTASENKAVFDRLVKELVAEKFNGFVDLVREEMEAIELPPAGEPGYTPQKGVDYWTEADKAEIEEELLDTLREGDIADINEELFHLEEALAELSAKAYFLNFAIYGGVNAPENPNENDIWINTDTEITSWAFSVDAPENPEEGMVWIGTGRISVSAFNALSNGYLMVYPVSASQFINGAWAGKVAKCYQNGEWKDWILYLRPSELAYTVYTGNPSDYYVEGDDIVYNNIGLSSTNSMSFTFDEPVDVSGFSKLKVTVDLQATAEWIYTAVAVTSTKIDKAYNTENMPPNIIASTKLQKKVGIQEVEVNLSSISQEVYVAVVGGVLKGRISNFRLE